MDFDFTTETITPDNTNILTIGGGGALELPFGATLTGSLPTGVAAGAVRYDTTLSQLVYNTGAAWVSFSGSVTSVAVTGSNGIGVGGSPITSSGTITLSLGAITPTSVASTGAVSGTTLTASTLTANSFLYSGTAGLLTTTAAPTNGQLLIGSTGAAPVAANITTSGVGISVTNGAGSIVLANTGVTSNVAGTGISVSGATGAVTISNTGVLSITGTANQVIASSATGAVTLSLPQSINTTATPTFNQVTITNPPVSGTDAVNLTYLQGQIAGLEWKDVAQAATTVNGTLATAFVAGTVIDGYTLVLGDRLLIKNQTTQTQNGIYVVTAGTPTRAIDANTTSALNNATLFVTNGTVNSDTGWTQTTKNPVIGTDNIVFVQFTGAGTYTAGTGLTLTGNTFSLTSPVVTTLGGTGTTTAPTSGQVLVGTTGGAYVPFTITTGTGISTTTGSGTLQINNTGVTSAIGTANQIAVSSATGAVTFSLPAAVTIGTSLTISGLTANSFVYSGTAGLLTATAAPTNGQLLIGSTGAAPVVAALTAGTGVSVTNAAGSITIANTGVVSFSAGTTGFTPSSATTGAVTLAGILNVANGGTGLGTTPANGALDIGNGTNFTRTTLTAGTGVSVTNGVGSITIANTGVTSVALADGSTSPIYTITGSPVTTTGTLTFTLATQTTNKVFAAPNGSTGQPTFRALAYADLPLKLYVENPSAPTTPIATGTNAVAIGTGSAASATDSFAVGVGSSAAIFGSRAYANGDFATAGDAQAVHALYRVLTSSNATVEAFLDGSGASQRAVLPNNSAWTFTIRVVARRTDATGTFGSWIYIGCITRDATAGTTSLQGAVSKTTLARVGGIVAANDPVLSADTTNGSLKLVVTGTTGDTIRWVADAELVQVTN